MKIEKVIELKILLFKENRIIPFILPKSGNFWVTDINENNEEQNLINVENKDDGWYLKSNFETKIIENDIELEEIKLENNRFYKIKSKEEIKVLYVEPTIEENYKYYRILKNEIKIGSNDNNSIIVKSFSDLQVKITFNGKIEFENTNTSIKTFLNNNLIIKDIINYGDVLFINGLKIVFLKGILMINNPSNMVHINTNDLEMGKINPREKMDVVEIEPTDLYTKEDYFYRSPRFKSIIEKKMINIDEPPAKREDKELPAILAIGPMVTMGLTSLVTATASLTNVVTNNRPFVQALPTLAIALASFGTMMIWPSITRKYNKQEKIKEEEKRQKKYKEYLETKKAEIDRTIKEQSNILRENYTNLEECQNIILSKKTNLWERGNDQDDFLTVRLGIGNVELNADIKYPEEKFVMEEDNLKVMIEEIVNSRKELENVPIVMSLTEKYITAIISSGELRKKFIEGLILQLITFQNYDFLKLVIITNKENEIKWKKIRNTPYCFDNDKIERYFATTVDEAKEISLNLEKEFQDRKINTKITYKDIKPYYLVITDNYDEIRDVDIIKDILNQEKNLGFGMIMLSNTIAGLPSECKNFISVGSKTSGIFESEISSGKQKEFVADFYESNIDKCYEMIANIPIELETKEGELPNTLSFLEMYGVGTVEQLNILARWQMNNVVQSMNAPIGLDKNGTLIRLDLHEKYHGPHGLIAGMTGSGKSEFIITYILSLACNYSPEDVSFILIDYKGGGLARVFENKETNKKLPHIAGTITNLETNEIDRALASVESELKNRQRLFNEAREISGESTIDIYKYQKLYKQGKVKEPMPHLLIITDEFAELKTDRPEFMEKLISTARIGRSLGVHLILATQKPAGVVNDQIWSNSRFRVCLKVQDKSDSTEMIKCPDAATLKNPGRFYLQVGYNELFVLGQSGYCGMPYIPTDKINKKEDNSIVFINNVGGVIEKIELEKKKEESKGEELINVIDYIIDTAKTLGLSAKKLWLDKIGDIIYVDNLIEMYDYKKVPFVLDPVIGEFDDPSNQRHGLVKLDLSKQGNTLIYGSPDSGKELLLSTIILSMAKTYSSDEINIYIADYGSETLKKYNSLPQVGDCILVNDKEKTENLFKYLLSELENRKKLFAEYNGDYDFYIKNSGNKLPNIVFIMNQYEAFVENYEMQNENLYILTRECAKYGIFVIVSLTNTMGMRTRIKQNFGNQIVLRMSNKDDYLYVMESRFKSDLPQVEGRGFVKLEKNVYEFQTARVFSDEDINLKTKELAEELYKQNVKANTIKVLPEVVTYDYLKDCVSGINKVPIGVNKDNLEIAYYDFSDNIVNPIVGMYLEELKPFTSGLCKILNKMANAVEYVIDGVKLLDDDVKEYQYINDNFDNIVEQIYKIIDFMVSKTNLEREKFKQYIFVIIGIEKFITKLSLENKNKVIEYLEKCKDISKISFIIVDSIDNHKNYTYNMKCKTVVQNNQFIWYGNGISDQYTLKTPYMIRGNLADGFGYVVDKNKINTVKLIEEKGETDNE